MQYSSCRSGMYFNQPIVEFAWPGQLVGHLVKINYHTKPGGTETNTDRGAVGVRRGDRGE